MSLLFSVPGVDGEIFGRCALSAKSRCEKMFGERGFVVRFVAACTKSLGKLVKFLEIFCASRTTVCKVFRIFTDNEIILLLTI